MSGSMRRGIVLVATSLAIGFVPATPAEARSDYCTKTDLWCKVGKQMRCWDSYQTALWAADDQFGDLPFGDTPQERQRLNNWVDGQHAAFNNYIDCLKSALANAADIVPYDFAFVANTSIPDGVVYRFNNEFPSGSDCFVTIYNGAGGDLEFGDALIVINGQTVADGFDIFDGASGFRTACNLVEGTNEVVISTATSGKGMLMLLLDDEIWPLPEEMD